MTKVAALLAVLALAISACAGDVSNGVVSLEDGAVADDVSGAEASELSPEDAILAFGACMRDNGVEDFEDPEIGSDGDIIQFRGQGGGLSEVDRETFREARTLCDEFLEGAITASGHQDRSEIEDQLIEFASCMRDQGVDMPDPDFSTPEQGGPFGDALDRNDPDVQDALDVCEDEFGVGRFPGGGGPAGGPSS